MGGSGPVRRRSCGPDRLFLVVPVIAGAHWRDRQVKDYLVPFIAAFLVCGVVFLGIDYVLMNLQGLSLIFRP